MPANYQIKFLFIEMRAFSTLHIGEKVATNSQMWIFLMIYFKAISIYFEETIPLEGFIDRYSNSMLIYDNYVIVKN